HGRNEVRPGEGIDGRSGNDTVGREWTGECGRRQRRAPIDMAVVAIVVDRAEYLERIAHTVIELTGDVVEVLIIAVDEAGELGRRDVDPISEPLHVGATA